ncbi:MAG: diacylglycerol kinase family protein [Saprospiraceae bacterium]|nr:MAG: diacylglycerol kinase family protein [Saprospiraceae bacterium]
MFKKRLDSFRYAFAGIAELVRSQPNAMIHLSAAALVIIAGLFFGLSRMEWCAVVFAITIVIAAEAVNTALEYLTDLISPNYHPLAGKAKDLAAGAVLISSVGAIVVGIIIFLPKVIALFSF